MIMKKHILVAVLVTFCLTFTLFSAVPTRSSSGDKQYDPWVDTNDDGVINMRDIGVMCDLFGASGTPINKTAMLLDLQNRVNALEERQNKVKTIRFYTSNETMADEYISWKVAATFVWTPENETDNVITRVYFYFRYRCENFSDDVYAQTWINGNLAVVSPQLWQSPTNYAWSPMSGGCYSAVVNQANYTLTFVVGTREHQAAVFVKDINVIIEVMDGLPAN